MPNDDIVIIPDDGTTTDPGSTVTTVQPDGSVIYGANSAMSVEDLSSLFSSLPSLGIDSELLQKYFDFIRENTNYNNSWSAEQAAIQRNWSSAERVSSENFNAAQAALNRNWQEYMSNSAHQREVADLKAAGLNPILSANGGNGAAVTSGATASVSAGSGTKGETDESANMAITSMLGSFLNAFMNLESTRVSAEASQAVADKYNGMSYLLKQMDQTYGKWEHENYPSNAYQLLSALLKGFTGEDFNKVAGNTAKNVKELINYLVGSADSWKDKFKNAWNNIFSGKYEAAAYNKDLQSWWFKGNGYSGGQGHFSSK